MKILILFSTFCAVAVTSSPRITNGDPIDITEVPFMVALEVSSGSPDSFRFTCGASIIGPNYFLTAGHCVNPSKPNNYRIEAGSTTRGSGTIYNVKEIHRHPQYFENETLQSADYDIAFLVITDSFNFTESVQPIDFTRTEPAVNDHARVTGWGRKEDGELPLDLLQANVSIIDRVKCGESFPDQGIIIPETMICAQATDPEKGPCKGDSGGPLVVNNVIVGIVSWGGNCDFEQGPAAAYTNVARFSDWVEEQIRNVNQMRK